MIKMPNEDEELTIEDMDRIKSEAYKIGVREGKKFAKKIKDKSAKEIAKESGYSEQTADSIVNDLLENNSNLYTFILFVGDATIARASKNVETKRWYNIVEPELVDLVSEIDDDVDRASALSEAKQTYEEAFAMTVIERSDF